MRLPESESLAAHGIMLLQVAREAIGQELQGNDPAGPDPERIPLVLRARRASFVTVRIGGELNGCIGTLEAVRSLVTDVALNACSAAFRDPRFPPLRENQFDRCRLHISVLSSPEPLEVDSEADLLRRLRPGIDGLVLRDPTHIGTFLPAVWESLPEPRTFLAELRRKAGLPVGYWADTLEILRYTVESFED